MLLTHPCVVSPSSCTKMTYDIDPLHKAISSNVSALYSCGQLRWRNANCSVCTRLHCGPVGPKGALQNGVKLFVASGVTIGPTKKASRHSWNRIACQIDGGIWIGY
ncbi:unnamed protein product [Albugo candida]|uniref:Uncharacterized protein n=1 Tax=Albugo candida TaxID=65357 RepID=A0A024GNP5_9STRA|nr:unnamed protein product [Albugo candida]|eukprot:CCI47952.1 unnamed protein product [Albugo candida]